MRLFCSVTGDHPRLLHFSSDSEDLKKVACEVCSQQGLQHEDGFVLKVAQYQELLDVRHSVMP